MPAATILSRSHVSLQSTRKSSGENGLIDMSSGPKLNTACSNRVASTIPTCGLAPATVTTTALCNCASMPPISSEYSRKQGGSSGLGAGAGARGSATT
jgi:hypothetical protein